MNFFEFDPENLHKKDLGIQPVWANVLGYEPMFQHHFQNWTDLIYWLVLHKPCSLELLFTVAWMIWLNGNAARAEDTVLHPLTLMQQGLELQRQYQVAKGLRRAELWTMCDLLCWLCGALVQHMNGA